MNNKKTNFNHFRVLLGSALLVALFSLSPWGVQLDNAIYDSVMVHFGEPATTDDIVIIGIDEPSFQEIGLQWPWPRALHAQLIEQLIQHNASVIAFDLLFPEHTDSKNDILFAKKITQARHVVIGTDYKVIAHPNYTIKTPIKPIGLLIDAGARTGHVSIQVDPDGFVRRLQPVLEQTPALSLSAAALHQNNTCCNLESLPNEILINYAADADRLKQVSYYQALQADKYLPKGFFKDKIVFIGVRSLSASLPDRQSVDHYASPLTRWGKGYTSGVMIHAFSTASLLTQSWGKTFPRTITTIAGFLLALGFARYGLRAELHSTILLGLAITGIISLSALLTFRNHHLYIPLFSTIAPILTILLISPYYNFLIERRRKKEIRKAFGTYVNETIVKQIEDNPESLKLGGKQIEGTVLFMDIAGFSGLTETESPETMINFINQFLSSMIEIGMEEGGTVERFLGDAIMLIWGAPIEQSDHAIRACRTALRMQKRLDEIADQAEQTYGFRVSARIGINSGSMTAGNIGGKDRFCYTVLGDCVNLAARFEAANKNYGTSAIIGQATVDAIEEYFPCFRIDVTKVKGRQQPETLYILKELIEHKSPVTDEQDKSYQLGLDLLLSNRPTKALHLFQQVNHPSLKVAIQLMQQRCKQLIDQPVNEDKIVFDLSKL